MGDNRVFDTREFRNALGAFATGVTVVTAAAPDGSRAGVTASSFNSVSLDPPMILWSLARNSRSLATFESALYWGGAHPGIRPGRSLESLRQERRRQVRRSRGRDGHRGRPLLKDYATRLQCKTAFKYEGGDHVIFVGEVLSFDHRDATPLLFHGGKYALAARRTEPAVLSGTSPRDSDISFGEDFLGYLLWRAAQHFQSRVTIHMQTQGLDPDTFMILAMLLHRDARSPKQLAAGMPPPAAANIEALLDVLTARGLCDLGRCGNGRGGPPVGGRPRGNAADSRSFKIDRADLLGRMESGEARH